MPKKHLLWPDAAFDGVAEITPQYLQAKGIRALVLDIDNTLTTHDSPHLPPAVGAWLAACRAAGIRLAVSSNNSEARVAPFASAIGVDYVANAAKPLPRGFARARAQFGVEKSQMAVVGDQLFTDVLGGRLYGIPTLLVRPMAPDTKWYIRLKRRLEAPILRRYEKSRRDLDQG